MKTFSTFAAYKTAENKAFKHRAVCAIKSNNIGGLFSVAKDIAAKHFARYLVLDSNGTKKFCWDLEEAYSWIPFCAKEMARIVDTRDFSVVAERKQAYVY